MISAEPIHPQIPRAEVSDARLAQLLRGLRLDAAITGCWACNPHRFIRPDASPEA